MNRIHKILITGLVVITGSSALQSKPRFSYAYEKTFTAIAIKNPEHLLFNDINQDGFVDVLAYGYNSGTPVWCKNDGTGQFGQEIILNNLFSNKETKIIDIQVNDMDSDGDPDIIFLRTNPYELCWIENNGTEKFGKVTIIDTLRNWELIDCHIQDLDGDGDTDLFLRKNAIGWYENLDGKGKFSKFQNLINPDEYIVYSSVLLDYEKDGDPDILLEIDGNHLFNFVLLENVEGFHFFKSVRVDSFSFRGNNTEIIYAGEKETPQKETYPQYKYQKKITDLDGDSSIDTLSVNPYAEEIETPQKETYPHYKYQKIITDLDGDSSPDILLSNPYDLLWMEINLKNKDVNTLRQIKLPFQGILPPVLADMDKDGDLDLFFISREEKHLAWIENVDGGELLTTHWIIPEKKDPVFINRPVLLADFDLDGDPDIIRANDDGYYLIIFENKEIPARFDSAVRINSNLSFGDIFNVMDIDNNGKMDILFSFDNGFYSYRYLDSKSIWIRILTFYPVLCAIILFTVFLILGFIYKEWEDSRTNLFENKPVPKLILGISGIFLGLMPIFTSYSLWWLIIGLPIAVTAVQKIVVTIVKPKNIEVMDEDKIDLNNTALSLVIFRQGTGQPSNPEHYYQKVAETYFKDFYVANWQIVGTKSQLSKTEGISLYYKLLVKQQLPVFGELVNTREGTGQDGSRYIALFFYDVKKLKMESDTKIYVKSGILNTIDWTKDGNQILRFPSEYEQQFQNHIHFIQKLKTKHLFLNLRVICLEGSENADDKNLIVISGKMSEIEKFFKLYFEPEVEAVFYEEFGKNDQNWSSISPPSSTGNVAAPGYSLDLTTYHAIVEKIKAGNYSVLKEI